ALVAYGYFVGGGALVDRVTIMVVVYFAGRVIDQWSSPFNILVVVVGLFVVSGLLSVIDFVFVFTFGAMFAILVVMFVVMTINVKFAGNVENANNRSARSAVSVWVVVVRPAVRMFAAS